MRALIALLVLALASPLLLGAGATTPASATYTGAGTVVTAFSAIPGTPGITVLDNGALVCRDADHDGLYESGDGGVCLTFAQLATGNAIYAHDGQVADIALAFQVCIDNNGDGICSGNGENGAYNPAVCADRIFFSHSQGGYTANPLAVDFTSAQNFFNACNKGGFAGAIVIMCAGVHSDSSGLFPHTHRVTTGTATVVTSGPTGSGNYCGGITAAKAYKLV